MNGINTDTAFGNMEIQRAIKRINTDSTIKSLEKAIEYIYIHTVPKTILISENEEDKKILEGLIRKDDSNRKWKQNQEQ